MYALTKGAAQTLGSVSMAWDFGEGLSAVVRSDSSAALAISQRVGLGKVRHLQVQYLWIQERHSEGSLTFQKVKGEINLADLLTKGVPQEILKRHVAAAGIELRGGRIARWWWGTLAGLRVGLRRSTIVSSLIVLLAQ